jgi:CBS domain-containing protein
MICPFCKTENIKGAEVCVSCGRELMGLDLPGEVLGVQVPEFVLQTLGGLSAKDVASVGVDDPVSLAVRRMQNDEIGCVLVMDGERVAGIITASDILNKVAGPDEDLNAATCGQIMTPDPVIFEAGDPIGVALNKMSVGEFRHIPFVQDDGSRRVMDVSDVFRYISAYMM